MRYILVFILVATATVAVARNFTSKATLSEIQLPEKQDTLKQGQHLYENKCGSCHFLYKPGKYTKGKWDMAMVKMAKKAKLTTEEEKRVRDYLFTCAKSN